MPELRPDWRAEIAKRLSQGRIDPASQPVLVEEFAQHLEDRYAELMASGDDEATARQATMDELNNLERVAERLPASKLEPRSQMVAAGGPLSGNLAADFLRDLRYALRGIRKSPVFTLMVGLTLGLGIGANTTVFTVINTLLLHPLPVNDAARLVAVYDTLEKDSKQEGTRLALSYLNFQDYAKRQTSFSGIAAYSPVSVMTLHENGGQQRAFGQFVSAGYFETLGLEPAFGRFFSRDEDSKPGSAPVAVLSYSAWQGRFGGSHDVIGRVLRLNRAAFTVVGVAPAGFLGISAIFGPDVWLPATMCELGMTGDSKDVFSNRGKPLLHGLARLKPGVSIRKAQSDLQRLSGILQREYPDTNEGHSILVRDITDELFSSVGGENGFIFGSAVLFVIVGLVLAIACSNVANLLLARSASRRQELAIRLSIGANRSRLVRQMLAESLLLSLIGFAMGLLAGVGGCRLVWSFVPPDVAQNMLTPKLDREVFLFSLTVSLLTALVFGLGPALRASKIDVVSVLKEEARTAGRGKRAITFANSILVAQVAFSLLCLITAALCFRSIQHAYTIDPGFQTGHLALFMTNPSQAGYDQPRAKDFYRTIRERVSVLPGVASAAWGSGLPFWNAPARSLTIEGTVQRGKVPLIPSVVQIVDTGYFETIGIPLIQGRAFTDADGPDELPAAVINEKLAQQNWPGGALGHRFQFAGEKTWRTIVGIAKNANYSTLGEAPQPAIYIPAKQSFAEGMTLYVKTKDEPSSMFGAVQNAIRDYDPNLVVNDSTGLTGARTGSKLIQQVLFGPRVGVTLLAVFGLLAMLLASIGLYGVMAYSVNGRRKEIGVRMALGASQSNVLRHVLREGMTVVGTGVALGLGTCLLLSRVLSRLLFGISSLDPISLAVASSVLLTVAFIACYFPARTATQVDPMLALRDS